MIFRSVLLLLICYGSLVIVNSCAPNKPHMPPPPPPPKHGYCDYYVDGTSDTGHDHPHRRRRAPLPEPEMPMPGPAPPPQMPSPSPPPAPSPRPHNSHSHSHESHEHSKGKDGKFTGSKKKKDVKCYKYEDGTKDDGAVLMPGVVDITVQTKSR